MWIVQAGGSSWLRRSFSQLQRCAHVILTALLLVSTKPKNRTTTHAGYFGSQVKFFG